MSKIDKEFSDRRGTFLFLGILLAFLILLLGARKLSYQMPLFEGETNYNETGWFFGEKGMEPAETLLSDQHLIEPGKTYELTTTLIYDGDNAAYPCALVIMNNYETRFFLDGEELFHYTREDRGGPSQLHSIGGAVFTVPLGENCGGKELRLELSTPMYYSIQRRLPAIQLGDYATLQQRLFFSSVPGMMISAAIAFVTLILLILGSSAADKRWSYIHFAVFSLIIVVYRSTEDLFLLYVTARPHFSLLLEYFSLAAAPIPLMLSYRDRIRPHFTKTFNVLILGLFAVFLAELGLHFTGTVDVVELLWMDHLAMLCCFVVLAAAHYTAAKRGIPTEPFRRLMPILLGTVVELLSYYEKFSVIGPGSFFPVGNYIGLGLLVSLNMMIWDARKARIQGDLQRHRSRILERMAYQDSLTGLYNRTALEQDLEKIRQSPESCRRIFVACDLNGLKRINDRQGHSEGDRMLQRAAYLLTDCFSGHGRVYRTGGDEFFAILEDVGEGEWQGLEREFRQEQDRRNREMRTALELALGYAVLDDSGIEACIQLADRRMYVDKFGVEPE